MAQTKKRKRSSKHRGNAAGMVETRGRTGRKLTAEERRKAGMKLSREDVRHERMRQPPTWKGAFVRGVFASMILVVILVLLMGRTVPQAMFLGILVIGFYVPVGFYTDQFLYQRRLKKDREMARR